MSQPVDMRKDENVVERRGVGDRVRTWWDGLARPVQWAVAVPLLLAIAIIPVYPPPILDTPGTSFSSVMAQFAMVALLAIGLNVVVGQTGLLDLGYVGFYAVGAYTVAILTSPNSPWNQTDGGFLNSKWAWFACVPIAIGITALSGLILGTPTLRLRGDYLAIVTLGFGEIVKLSAENLPELTNGSLGLSNIQYPHVGESDRYPNGVFFSGNISERLNVGVWWFWFGMAMIIIVLLLVGNLERSRVGRSWVAIREDEDVAEIMGVPTFKFKLWAFTIGAAIGGLSGAMYAGQVQFVNPTNFNIINSMLFLCAVVLGGQGNKLGVIVGAFIIVYLPNRFLSVEVGGQALGSYKYLFFGLALVVLMIFRPQGLFPARQKLLAYGRQVYQAVRRPVLATGAEK
ncbi:branched-chain amino acid ABC transporter permease [Antrihabitans sp. YC2-6]|uniref:branched-chain amino acid ABC transporter permease n=1 Tax=Antrihabitans sp. YC2-6 TaxID=2799498 RepID=UPI0018F62A11|nr:branched-chain amino acid ABC transporter permease [Antrihabitans sp. YC2-6]MBJ8343103.1 branched-chain amino acid ABC transporter permease [Antrihabitans sp. YC2-6]